MQDDAGSVDDATQRRRERGFNFDNDFGDDASFQFGRVERLRIWRSGLRWLVFQARTEFGKDAPDDLGDESAPGFFGQVNEARLEEQFVHGRNGSEAGA